MADVNSTGNNASSANFVDPYANAANGIDMQSFLADPSNYFSNFVNQKYDRANVLSARAWDEYVNKHKIQWQVEDIKNAGLNPWLALNGGSINGGQLSSSASGEGNTAKLNLKSKTEGVKTGLDAASKIFMALMVAAKMLA